MSKQASTQGLTPALIREAHGLTLQQAAEKAAIHRETLRSLERGDSVTVKTVRDVAAVYGLTPDALLKAMEVAASQSEAA